MSSIEGKRQARTHEQNRRVICALCFEKKGVRILTKSQELKIQELDPGFSTLKNFLPTGICNACRISLCVSIFIVFTLYCLYLQNSNSGQNRKPPVCPKYENIKGPAPATRSSGDQVCGCTVCQAARLNLPAGPGSGHLSDELKAQLFPHISSEPSKAGNPSSVPGVVKLCSLCLTEVRRGISHTCSQGTMRSNLAGLVKSKSKKTKAKVTVSALKAVFADQDVSTAGGTATLPTGGTPVHVTVGKLRDTRRAARWSHTDLKRLQSAMNLSDRNVM